MLLKGCQLARGKGEPAEKLLKRATHLALQGKGIERISNLHLCSQLRVLYLYDNRIRSLEGLGGVSAQLTHLYLQNNDIGGLNGLPVPAQCFFEHQHPPPDTYFKDGAFMGILTHFMELW
eukprot:RCo005073